MSAWKKLSRCKISVNKKRVLLLYITNLSGHHRAAMAVEKGLKYVAPDLDVRSVNSFNYTNPILEKIINRTYMGIIKRTPEVWEYLYDNPGIVRNTQRLKDMMHRYNSAKMKALIDEFKPDVIACTQAFPCGMVADYKTTFKSTIPLVGVLTDFYPHSYWIYEAVDAYAVASEEAKQRLVDHGIPADKIRVLGIPIDLVFREQVGRDHVLAQLGLENNITTILVMGGSTGLGPIKKIVLALERIKSHIQIIVVTGKNIKLYNYLKRNEARFRHRIATIGYATNVYELMAAADAIVTKPGGLTTSEALAKGLALIIINPIPGQEAKNTDYLLRKQAAIKARNEDEVALMVESLCSMPFKLDAMKKAAHDLGRPDAAINIANMMLEL